MRLQDSESQRLNLISQNNKESFALNTKFAKLRTDFEKSEATRQTLEYELSLAKANFGKEKQASSEKERMLEELSKNYQGTFNLIVILEWNNKVLFLNFFVVEKYRPNESYK